MFVAQERKTRERVTCLHDHSLAVVGCRADVYSPVINTAATSGSLSLKDNGVCCEMRGFLV